MAITNGYATLSEFKARLDLSTTDTTRDAYIEQMVETASRWIDGFCWRRFYTATETRYYAPEQRYRLEVDDLLTVTALKTDEDGDGTFEITWAVTDYQLEPRNAALAIPPGPYTSIRVKQNGVYTFPLLPVNGYLWTQPIWQQSVEIAGSWGYASTIPDAINEACLLKSIQIYKRRTGGGSPSGGSAATGQQALPSDKAITELLEPYRRLV